MNCEGCEKDVGDLKTLKAHRKACEKYKTWCAQLTPIAEVPVPRSLS